MENRINPGWRPRCFAALVSLALILIASWIWPVTRGLWTNLDETIFTAVNSTLAIGKGWAGIWAVGNSRYFDFVVGLIMLTLILRKNLIFQSLEVRRALFTMAGLMGLLVIMHAALSYVVTKMGWQHQSPSRVMDNTVYLHKIFPEMKRHARMKDTSPRSFPGDHASVLILWAMFLVTYARGKMILIPVALAALFSFPRVIAGAHWFSDIMVGSVMLASLAYALGYCTPLLRWWDYTLERLSAPLIGLLRRWPWFRKISLFQ